MLKSLRFVLMVGLVLSPLALRSDETPAMQAFYEGVSALQKAAAEPTFQQQQQGWAKAEESFRKAVELKSDYADAYNKLGQSLFNQGKLFDAVTEFKHAVAIDPRLTEAWYHLGYGFENIADEKKVKDDEKAKKKLAKTAAKDAIAAYSKAIEVDPSNDIDARARAFFRRGVLERDAAVSAPSTSSATGAQARSGQALAQNLKPAMLDLEEANKLLTDFPEARNELGRLYDIIGRYPEAIEQFDKAIRGDKNYAEAYSNRGVAWWKAGNWDKALEDTRQATVVDPKFAGGHYNFAEVIFARVQELRLKGGDSDRSVIHLEAQKAVDEYRVCTELDPTFMPGWYGLAKAQHGYHDFAGATQTYNKILDMDKRQKDAKKLLKDLLKEEKTFTSHIPKEYREGGK